MTNDLTLRITIDVIIVIAVLMGWWFVALPVGIIAAWVFPKYLELIVFSFMHDVLFGFSNSMIIWSYSWTIVSSIIIVAMYFLKVIVRNNS